MANIAEWQVARTVLSSFDERIHDLRKTGFSFITALLTAESVLFKDGTDAHMKCAVLVATLVLVVAMRTIEKHYQLIQAATALRANVLERSLNFELTEVISDKYARLHITIFIEAVYILFISATVFLGWFALDGHSRGRIGLVTAGLLAVSAILCIRNFGLEYSVGMLDWSLDRTNCAPGDRVAITLTNLSGKSNLGGEKTFRILDDRGTAIFTSSPSPEIREYGNYIWLWHANVSAGVYQIEVNNPMDVKKVIILRRKVIVS